MMDYFSTRPNKKEIIEWLSSKEKAVINNEDLLSVEKSVLINHKVLLRYAIKYKLDVTRNEIFEVSTSSRISSTGNCDFWSQLKCWAGSLSTFSSLGASIGKFAGPEGAVVGAAIGFAIGIVNAAATCLNCNNDVCQAFTGVAFPYLCYTLGNNISIEGWGYGNRHVS